jgi:sulfoxide reductase heme-binding subunit YedZ
VTARELAVAALRAPQRHYRWTWLLALSLCLAPFALLAWEYAAQRLGVNPFERLSHFTGTWALNLLLVTLAVTPARRHAVRLARAAGAPYGRRYSDWNWLVKLRRTLGLAAFFYAFLHASVYLGLDLGLKFSSLVRDFSEKPYIIAGMTALALLVPLAATSTDAMMRRLGRNWRRLHRTIYAVGVVAVLHYLWFAKAGITAPYYYAGVLFVLLADRIVAALAKRAPGRPADDDMEVPER